MGQQQTISEATARTIDAEVRRLVEAGLAEASRRASVFRASDSCRRGLCQHLRSAPV
jgi:cell division protease FtsH